MGRKFRAGKNEAINRETIKDTEKVISFDTIFTREGLANDIYKSWDELKKTAWTAENIPVVIDHPETIIVVDYTTVIGYVSDVVADEEEKALKAKVNIFSIPENAKIIKQIKEGDITEVSPGYWSWTNTEEKDHGGIGTDHNILYDHLALLPYSKGACSNAKGCGIFPEKENTYILQNIDEAFTTNEELPEGGPIPWKDEKKADVNTEWKFNAKDYTIKQLIEAGAWLKRRKKGEEITKDDIKLPHHLPDGRVVLAGVRAAGNALMGARGGVKIPEEDLDGVKAHLEKEYEKFGATAPWKKKEKEDKEMKENEEKETKEKKREGKETSDASEVMAHLNEENRKLRDEIKELTVKLNEYKEKEKEETEKRITAKRNYLSDISPLTAEEIDSIETEEALDTAIAMATRMRTENSVIRIPDDEEETGIKPYREYVEEARKARRK